MRCYTESAVEGGWCVRLGPDAVRLSHHDTRAEADAAAAAYAAARHRNAGPVLVLSNGSPLRIRPVHPTDKALFAESWTTLGEQSRYLRYLGYKKRLSMRDLAYLTDIDHVEHEALIGIDAAGDHGQIGVARYVRVGPDTAEAAVAVADRWQGQGVGTLLLERLSRHGSEHGIRAFTATLFRENVAMMRAFQRLGGVSVTQTESSVIEIEVELPVGAGHPQAR